MIAVTTLFYEESTFDSLLKIFNFKTNDDKLVELVQDKDVIEFIKVSESIVRGVRVSPNDLTRFHLLMNKSKVKEYLERIQYIDPIERVVTAITGAGIVGLISGITITSLPVAAFAAVLGGIVGGVITDLTVTEIKRYMGGLKDREKLYKKAKGYDIEKSSRNISQIN